MIAALATPVVADGEARAVLQEGYLESRFGPDFNEVKHYGTLTEFSGSTRTTYPTFGTPSSLIASARYEMTPDRMSVTFEFDHYRNGPAPGYPLNTVGLQIDAETDYRFEVSGGYAFADPTAAAHTEFVYDAKIHGPDLIGPGGVMDDRFLYGASSWRDGVTAIEFGPRVEGEFSAGSLTRGTQGMLEAGLVYNLGVTTQLLAFSEEAHASTAEGNGWFTLTLTPIPEPCTALLLGLGLALTNVATSPRRTSRSFESRKTSEYGDSESSPQRKKALSRRAFERRAAPNGSGGRTGTATRVRGSAQPADTATDSAGPRTARFGRTAQRAPT